MAKQNKNPKQTQNTPSSTKPGKNPQQPSWGTPTSDTKKQGGSDSCGGCN